MEHVTTWRLAWRVALAVAVAGYALLYVFVLFVAFATSGPEVFQRPGAIYAAVAPLLYVSVAGAWAFRRMPLPSAPALLAIHVAAAPTLLWSFLHLGVLLPVLALLWWAAARGEE